MRSKPQRRDHISDISRAGDNDKRNIRKFFFGASHHLKAVHLGHSQVCEDQRRLFLVKNFQTGLSILSAQHPEVPVFQVVHQTFTQDLFILYDQDCCSLLIHRKTSSPDIF